MISALPRRLPLALVLSVLCHLLVLVPLAPLFFAAQEDSGGRMEARLLPPPALAPSTVAPTPPKAQPERTTPPVSPSPIATPPAPAQNYPSILNPTEMPVVETPPQPAVESEPLPAAKATVGTGEIEFEVSKGESRFVLGKAVHRWSYDGSVYHLQSAMETTGLVSLFSNVKLSQSSRGRITDTGLQPQLFEDVRKDKRYTASLDWAEWLLRLDNGTLKPIQPGMQDLLSLLYQFAWLPLTGETISVPVTNGRKAATYTFKITAEPVQLGDGNLYAARRLFYQGADGEGLEIWLSEAEGHLPLRIRYLDRKGGMTELLAVRYPQTQQETAP